LAARNKGQEQIWRKQVMIKEIKGQLAAGKGNYGIVVSRFNEFVTGRLLAGAIDCLQRHGATDEQITVVWVPGICEIVQAAKRLAKSGKYAAVICLGAGIRGQTSHYEYVCQQAVRGIGQINYDTDVPTIFGVLTCETLEQAVERAGGKKDNAGADAARAAIEMVSVVKQM
jgi:6,7-dimethyl-8-ribityllumazine synthase